MANKLFSDKIIFRKNLTPSPFGTDLCCRYVTSKGFRHVVALNKPFILRRMQHFFYKINTEAARNTQTLGGKPIFSSEILAVNLENPLSYFCRVQYVLEKYQLPSLEELKIKQPSKDSWKSIVKEAVNKYWSESLTRGPMVL